MLKDLRTLWAILGFVTMTPVIASLIRNGLHLPTGGIVAVVLDQYGIYRDAIFSLVEMGLKYLSELFKLLPAFVRDLVSFYSIGFTAWMLTSRWTYLDDKRRYEEDRQNFEEAIRGAASDHNKNAEKNWLKVQLGLLNPKFRMLRHIWASLRWPIVASRNLKQAISSTNQGSRLFGQRITIYFFMFLVTSLILAVVAIIWGWILSV